MLRKHDGFGKISARFCFGNLGNDGAALAF